MTRPSTGLSLRIVRVRYKLLYLLAWIFGDVLLAFAFNRIQPPLASAIEGLVYSLIFLALGMRVFRGAGEPVEAPRPWWKATSRPLSGYPLGVLFALFSLGLFTSTAQDAQASEETRVVSTLIAISAAAAAIMYFQSSTTLLVVHRRLSDPRAD
jgi:hypothetical protein